MRDRHSDTLDVDIPGKPSFLHKSASRLSLNALREHLRTPLYANAYYLMGTSISRLVTGFAFWAMAARLYSPANVGLGSALLSAVLLLASLSTLGLGQGLIRFLPHAGQDANFILNSSLTLSGVVSVLAAATFVVGLPLWSPPLLFLGRDAALALYFVLFVVVATVSTLSEQAFVAHRAARFALVTSVVSRLLSIGLLLALGALVNGFGIAGSVFTAQAATVGLTLVWLLPRVQLGYSPRLAIPTRVVRATLSFSLANYVGILLADIAPMVLPLMVVGILGAEANAHFYAAWVVAGPLFMIPTALSASLFAEGSHQAAALRVAAIKAGRLGFLLVGVAVAAAFAFGGTVLTIAFGQSYATQATSLLRLLSLSALPVVVKGIVLSVYRVRRDMHRIVLLAAIDGCLTLGLVWALMPAMGLPGLGLGHTTAQCVVAAAGLVSLKRKPRRVGYWCA